MDVSVQYVDPVKEDLLYRNDWGHWWSNCQQGSSSVGSLVLELGIALEDALVLLSTSAPSSEGCDVRRLEKKKGCEELNDQDKPFLVTPQKKWGELATLPSSRNMLFCDSPVSGKDSISNTALDQQSSLKPGNPTSSTSIVSHPISSKVVSAMKGSREKRGLHVEKLSVKWAPDVYDPPITSQSHTVKSYSHYGPKMSKKSKRHKHKGKSPRSNSIDKKPRRKSSSKVSS